MGLSSSTTRPDQDKSKQRPGTGKSTDLHLRNLDRPEMGQNIAVGSQSNRISGSAPAATEDLRPVDLDPDAVVAPEESEQAVADTTRTRPPNLKRGARDRALPNTRETEEDHPETTQGTSGKVWLAGHTLRFPQQTALAPGELIELSGRAYEIHQNKNYTLQSWLRWSTLGVLVLLATFGVAHLFSGAPDGSVTGVVVDRVTGKIVGRATVTVANGPTVRTNAAGLFVANGLPEGLFELTASAFGYENQSGTVTRTDGKQAQLAFALMPLVVDSAEIPNTAKPAMQTETREVAEARPPIAYGHIELEIDFSKYLVFVDNILYGKNTEKVKRLTAGKHKIILQVEGFEDYATMIDVKARKTHTLKVAKADFTPKINPIKRAKSHFATAKEHFDNRRWQAAVKAYGLGLGYAPHDTRALQYRAWAYSKSGDTDNARRDFRQAATIHNDANQYLDAVACAGYLIELDPDSAIHYQRRAEYYLALKEHRKAIDDYKDAVRKDKSSSPLRLGLAEAYFVAGNYKDAAKEFDRARKLVDDPTDVYVRMLIALTRAGDDSKVRRKYRDLTEFADPERLTKLRQNPEWLRVLQIVDPLERSDG